MSKKLENKTALITGGSAGIGLATATLFAQEGAKVIITGRKAVDLEKAVKAIGHNAVGIVADSSRLSDLDRLYAQISEKGEKLDILIANAAAYILAPLGAMTEEQFDRQSNTNFKGTFFTVQKALPLLNKGASVILLSSVVNEKGVPNHASYAATKAAIRSLGRSFSAELLSQGMRVNVLSPGPIDTDVFNQAASGPEEAKAIKKAMGDFTPIKRLGSPEEIAAAALYLASADSAYMVGAELLIDGGLRSL